VLIGRVLTVALLTIEDGAMPSWCKNADSVSKMWANECMWISPFSVVGFAVTRSGVQSPAAGGAVGDGGCRIVFV
jgi:hypothetical protein